MVRHGSWSGWISSWRREDLIREINGLVLLHIILWSDLLHEHALNHMAVTATVIVLVNVGVPPASCHCLPRMCICEILQMQARQDQPHTARIFEWTLIEMRHQFWVREANGHAKLYMWRDFQQFPISLFWKSGKNHQKWGFWPIFHDYTDYFGLQDYF